ncbi:MAG: hypothetical protein MJ200_05705 [Mycoplasmoidaceae bacterium]|nr:hypothetical protein [Mycoplasmoidaceae bacterium]
MANDIFLVSLCGFKSCHPAIKSKMCVHLLFYIMMYDMKRKLILLPITLTALTPMISLSACGEKPGPEPEPTKLEFSVSNCSMSSYIEATISLDWQPTEDKITFTNFLFIYDGTKQVTDITPQGLTYDRPNVLKIVFSEEIDHDINGILTFNYDDETSKISGTGSVSDIVIPKYVPPAPCRTDFNTCGWSDIIQACDLLEETGSTSMFCDTFQLDDLSTPDPYDKKNATTMQDFIGQERNVEINGNNHKVIVLDTQEDTIYQEGNVNGDDTKAALTFQFKNVICDSDGNAMQCD